MNLPVRFPNNAVVIYEDAARFRAMSPEEQVRALGSCFDDYQSLRLLSGRAEQIDRFDREEESREWKAIQEFAARHQ